MRDRLNDLRHFVECAWLAAGTLPREEANAIQTVLDHASSGMEKLGEDMAGDPADEAEEGEEEANG